VVACIHRVAIRVVLERRTITQRRAWFYQADAMVFSSAWSGLQ
jgi:hypothetical protein